MRAPGADGSSAPGPVRADPPPTPRDPPMQHHRSARLPVLFLLSCAALALGACSSAPKKDLTYRSERFNTNSPYEVAVDVAPTGDDVSDLL